MDNVSKASVLAGFLLIVSVAPTCNVNGMASPRGIVPKPLKEKVLK